jgi:hypothetical protein
MKCLGLHNKPTAEVHPGHKLTGPKEEEEEEEEQEQESHIYQRLFFLRPYNASTAHSNTICTLMV